MYVRAYIYMFPVHTEMSYIVRTYVPIHVHTCTYNMYLTMYVHVRTSTYMYVRTYVCTVHMDTHTHAQICMHFYTYIHMY